VKKPSSSKRKRTAGKPGALPYGSISYVNQMERKRRERQRRGFQGRQIAPSYLTTAEEAKKQQKRKRRS
jgi:hypothetical protein